MEKEPEINKICPEKEVVEMKEDDSLSEISSFEKLTSRSLLNVDKICWSRRRNSVVARITSRSKCSVKTIKLQDQGSLNKAHNLY